MDNDFEKNLRKFRNYISNTYNEFYVWRTLQKAENNELYNRYNYFWLPAISCLQNEFLLNLAKIFEPGKHDVLSIYYLINLLPEVSEKEEIIKEVEKYRPVIRNLWKQRNKILAHNDIYFAHNSGELFKNFPIKNNEIEELLNLLGKLLGRIHSLGLEKGTSYAYSFIEDESEGSVKQLIKHLKLGFELEKEQLKKELESYKKIK